MSSFDDYICARTSSDADRFQLLCTLTKGDAHILVEACINLPKEQRYHAARKHLEEVYGNPHLLVGAIMMQLDKLSSVPEGDGKALRRFAVELRSCELSLRGLSASYRVNAPEKIQAAATKLPLSLRKQWRKHSTDIALKGEVTFGDFVTFVQHEADRLNIPVFGELVQDQGVGKSLSCVTSSSDAQQTKIPVCGFCKRGRHSLERCFQFEGLSTGSKKSFIRGAELCFSCLRAGHVSSRCVAPMKRDRCSGNHPSCLHQDSPVPPASTSSSSNVGQTPGVSACVVRAGSKARIAVPIIPLLVGTPFGTEYIRTYAALDNFSSDCFISRDLARALDLKGTPSTLSVSTLEKEASTWHTVCFQGLEVKDLDGNNPHVLPPLFSRDSLPFDKSHIPQSSDWESHDHLREIPFEIIDASVGLLLGMNASELLRPLEVAKGPDNSPFGIRYLHGWALNGSLNGPGSTFVHRVEVRSRVEEMIEQFYAQEFKDTELDEKAPSVEEQEFLSRAKTSLHYDGGHFCLDLPVRRTAPPFQNNCRQAYRRIEATRSRLQRDDGLQADYSKFMQEMLERGFMEPVPDVRGASSSDVWYIVHHAVYHKEKKKIRVVFNCSLKFQGLSLNDRLLKGPDLTNSLIGVLLRFRQHHVALQGDI